MLPNKWLQTFGAKGPDVTTVGFLGLGRMGARMASRLGQAGYELALYNRTRDKADQLGEQLGATVSATPAAVARSSDIVITMLADGSAVEEVYEQREGVLEGIRPGCVGIEMSTIGPEAIIMLGGRMHAAGASLIDAPVSGSVALAEAGTLTIMVGGDGADLDRVKPVLQVLGSTIFHMGPLGSGATMKLVVNAVVYALNEAVSEALVLAERSGIDRKDAYDVFASSAIAAPFVHYRRQAFEHPEDVPVAFRLALAEKDLQLILAFASRMNAQMPQAETNLAVLREASARGFSEHDVSGVAEFLRMVSHPAQGPSRRILSTEE